MTDAQNSGVELLPCPCCGSGPAKAPGRFTQASFSGVEVMNEIYSPYVWCGTCCLRTRECDSKAEAIIAWNTRVPTPSDHAGWQDALTGCVGIESNGGNGGHPWVRVSFTEPGQEVALHYSLLAELIPTPPILTAGSGEGA